MRCIVSLGMSKVSKQLQKNCRDKWKETKVLLSGDIINMLKNDVSNWRLFCNVNLLHLLLFRYYVKVGVQKLIFN